MSFFAFFEVGFIGGVVGIRISLYLDMSLDGRATGAKEPDLAWLSVVVPDFAEEGPILTAVQCKVFLFAPASGLSWVPSSCPPP
jgi:hypothetical protein